MKKLIIIHTGAAWPSSARVVRRKVKSYNERNPDFVLLNVDINIAHTQKTAICWRKVREYNALRMHRIYIKIISLSRDTIHYFPFSLTSHGEPFSFGFQLQNIVAMTHSRVIPSAIFKVEKSG